MADYFTAHKKQSVCANRRFVENGNFTFKIVFVAREASWGVFGIGAKKAELIKDEATLKYVLGEEAMGKNSRIKKETGAVVTQAVNTTQKMAKQLNQDRDAALTDLALFAVGGKVLNKLTGKLKLSGKAVSTTIAKAEAKAVTKVVAEETTKQVVKRGSKYFRRATKRFNKKTSRNFFQQTQEFFGNLFKGKPSTSTEPVVSGSMKKVKARKKTNIKAQPQPTTLPPVKSGSARKVKTQQNPIQQFTSWLGQLNKPQKAPKP
jgi:hypothetical protein